jgi:hypothetical protein
MDWLLQEFAKCCENHRISTNKREISPSNGKKGIAQWKKKNSFQKND